MFRRHVVRELTAYRQNELPPLRARRVGEHLAGCAACRRELDEISFGIRLAEKLPAAEAPDSVWVSVRDALDRPSRSRFLPRAVLVGATVAVALVAAGLAWYFTLREPLRVTETAGPVSRLEAVAIAEHFRRIQGRIDWQIRTTDLARLRRWVGESSGLSADEIPIDRPAEDAGRLRIVGARLARVDGATAAVIGYEMDSEPVTLATARLGDLRDAPHVAPFSKDVRYRLDREHGYKVVTWGVSHKAYAMVSRLPGYGQTGCFLCHTAPERRRLIDSAKVLRN
ncbi:MAG TPA: zf-HC2 domain-containing protein [Thermoanaerobaculia bacterium]|nr:zf-HC2 domain-containing protein [Thermoanaerobaculia bacterium]